MIPKDPLPLPEGWEDTESYVDSLLSFATSSALFKTLCGGVHVLDFLTRDPDLYSSVLPASWREFFDQHEISDILDLLLREDIEPLRVQECLNGDRTAAEEENTQDTGNKTSWRGGSVPPQDLLEYIHQVRRHTFKRDFTPNTENGKIPRHVALGMKPKKVHEVQNFSRYVSSLTADVARARGGDGQEGEDKGEITHIVDFGSGQNYLGRTLVNPPFNKHVIAIERSQDNITGAKGMDVLTKKTIVLKAKRDAANGTTSACGDGKYGSPSRTPVNALNERAGSSEGDSVAVINVVGSEGESLPASKTGNNARKREEGKSHGQSGGHIDYVEHDIQDGYLEPIIDHIINEPQNASKEETGHHSSSSRDPRVMVVSLHSCGNLVHHGIRSLILNPSVAAIAMIGCCYNLMTERLSPTTWKLPSLRSLPPWCSNPSTPYDPHGFPMSRRLESYPDEGEPGIKLNITARTLAVQAPTNWGPEDSEGFFKRHFFRALLQRVLLDRGVVPKPGFAAAGNDDDPTRKETPGTPLIVGSLPKAAFISFPAYARAALGKLVRNESHGSVVREKASDLSDDELNTYVEQYWGAKKNLSIVWSLMAFSAGVVEAMVVTDRWLFLREQEAVKDVWVEPVFDYTQSPRNLVVVGIKK